MGFVLIRKRSDLNTLPAVVLSGLFITVVSLAAGGSLAISAIEPGQGWLLALLVAVVLPLSFSMIFVAPRFIPAPEVNMIMLLEMILGPLMVWLAIGEAVPPATFAGGGLLFAILLAHSWAGLRNRPGKAVRRTGRA
jgi:drug/metabolite transporter (DMT)-like permease